MSLPVVTIGHRQFTRLTIGGNPFSGISHQTPERDREMLDYYTVDRIKRTLFECEAAGINTACLRVDAHICRLLREFRAEGGRLQWIAQMGPEEGSHEGNINRAAGNGAVAYYIHGGVTDKLYSEGKMDRIAELVDYIQKKGMLAGIAGHLPEAHLAIYEAQIPADFHVVCFYNCGSVHAGCGEKFVPEDPPVAVEAIQKIQKPCIGYKVMAAGRNNWQDALRYAYSNIKPGDIVNLGMFTKDKPNMAWENAQFVQSLLGA